MAEGDENLAAGFRSAADRPPHVPTGPPRRGWVLIGREPSTSTWVLWCLLGLCGLFTAAFAAAPFLPTTVEVTGTPAFRTSYTRVEHGRTITYVKCPGALASSRGSDPLCRQGGRDQLTPQLVGLALFLGADVALVLLISSRRARRRAG